MQGKIIEVISSKKDYKLSSITPLKGDKLGEKSEAMTYTQEQGLIHENFKGDI